MDQFELKYFNICRIHMLMIGLWPYQKRIFSVPLRIGGVLGLLSFGIEITGHLIISGTSMQIFIDDIPYFFIWLLMVTMYASAWCQLNLLKKMLVTVKYDWQCAILDKEDHILESITKQGWKHAVYILTMTYIMTTFYSIFTFAPDFLSDKFPWNTTYTRQPFMGMYLLDPDKDIPLRLPYSFAVVLVTAVGSCAAVLQFHMLITHACGMYGIFGHRLEHAFNDNPEKRIEGDGLHTALVCIVEQHLHITGFVDNLKSYYEVFCCIVGLSCVLMIISLLLNVCINIRNERDIELAILVILILLILFLNAFIVCTSAQGLVNASSDVFHQMYCGEWYTASIPNQKALLLIMCNCKQPVGVVFSTVLMVSLETYYTFLEASLSYFTVIYSLL